MSATANLSVGLNTSKAKDALRLLRQEMAKDMTFAVSIDPEKVDKQLRSYLRNKTFTLHIQPTTTLGKLVEDAVYNSAKKGIERAFDIPGRVLKWNQAAFAGGINAALEQFSQERKINFNRAALIAEIDGAITTAFGEARRLNVNPVASAAPVASTALALPVGAIQAAIAQSLTPALEEIGKAATLMAGAVKRLPSDPATAVAGAGRASLGYSFKDAESGSTSRYTQPLPDPVKALANIKDANERLAQEKMLAESSKETFRSRRAARRFEITQEAREAREAQQDANLTFQARKRARQYDASIEAREAREAQQDSNRTFAARRSARRAEDQRLEREYAALQAASVQGQKSQEALAAFKAAEETRRLRESQQDSNRTFAARQRARRFDEALEARQARESQQDSNRTFAARRAARRFDETQEARQNREAQLDSNRTFAARRAARKAEDAALRLEMARFYESAKYDGKKQFTGVGPQIFGAQALAGQYGSDQAAKFLGAKSDLLYRAGDLDRLKVKTKEAVAESTKLGTSAKETAAQLRAKNTAAREAARNMTTMKDVMKQGHDAARGFAGSLGLLWLTWGSIAPLLAGAALGASFRSVFNIGKDLEYQLTFVSVLTDAATISTERFATAMRGSTTAPTEAAEALRGLAQNGLSASEALQALPDILALATAGEMSLSAAALGATGVMAAFNLTVFDLGKVGDVFAKAAALSNTSVAGMVEAMKQASTVGSEYNVTLEETAASLAMLAKRNIDGTAAGTALRNMINELAAPTNKAKEAIAVLGLSFYDSNKQLKPYSMILTELEAKLTLLDEKSRLGILSAIFNERGAKAASAIMSNLRQYNGMLDEITNKSEDFTKTVVEALGETTQGKIKKLFTEYQITAAKAFDSSRDSINMVLDTLRSLVGSTDFQTFIASVSSNVASLTRVIVDNGNALMWVGKIWLAYKAGALLAGSATLQAAGASLAYTLGLRAQGAAAAAAAAATTTATVAARGFATVSGIATGGLSILLGLLVTGAAEWLLFRKHTDDATASQQAFNAAMGAGGAALLNANKGISERNALMLRVVELQKAGMSYQDARAQAEGEEGGDRINRNLSDARARLDQAQKRKKEIEDTYQRTGRNIAKPGELGSIASAIRVETELVTKYNSALELAKANQDFDKQTSGVETISKQLDAAKTFREDLERYKELNKKANVSGLVITDDQAANMAGKEFDKLLERNKAALNKMKDSITMPSSEADAERNALRSAKTQGVEADIRRQEEALKRGAQSWRDYNTAKYDQREFGAAMAALIAEQTEREYSTKLVKFETDAVTRLQLEKGKAEKASDKQKIQNEIEARQASIKVLKQELDQRVVLARLKSDSGRGQEERSIMDALTKADETARRAIDDRRNTALGREDLVSKAKTEAELETEKTYNDVILGIKANIAKYEGAINSLVEDRFGLTEADEASQSERLAVAGGELTVAQRLLEVARERARISVQAAGADALRSQEYLASAEFGWNKFWEDYRKNAQTNAAVVEDILKSSTSRMTDAFTEFVTTGKTSFKGLVASIFADAARMASNRAVASLLNMGLNALGGVGGGSSWSTSGSLGAEQFALLKSASGNVMTSMGPMPLGAFQKGGIGRQPMVSMIAEGQDAEAYVPLPDGRTIPVTMSSSGGGGGNTTVSVAVYVNSDGSTKVNTSASEGEAKRLGQRIADAARQVIIEEKRPGGLLYA